MPQTDTSSPLLAYCLFPSCQRLSVTRGSDQARTRIYRVFSADSAVCILLDSSFSVPHPRSSNSFVEKLYCFAFHVWICGVWLRRGGSQRPVFLFSRWLSGCPQTQPLERLFFHSGQRFLGFLFCSCLDTSYYSGVWGVLPAVTRGRAPGQGHRAELTCPAELKGSCSSLGSGTAGLGCTVRSLAPPLGPRLRVVPRFSPAPSGSSVSHDRVHHSWKQKSAGSVFNASG